MKPPRHTPKVQGKHTQDRTLHGSLLRISFSCGCGGGQAAAPSPSPAGPPPQSALRHCVGEGLT